MFFTYFKGPFFGVEYDMFIFNIERPIITVAQKYSLQKPSCQKTCCITIEKNTCGTMWHITKCSSLIDFHSPKIFWPPSKIIYCVIRR